MLVLVLMQSWDCRIVLFLSLKRCFSTLVVTLIQWVLLKLCKSNSALNFHLLCGSIHLHCNSSWLKNVWVWHLRVLLIPSIEARGPPKTVSLVCKNLISPTACIAKSSHWLPILEIGIKLSKLGQVSIGEGTEYEPEIALAQALYANAS